MLSNFISVDDKNRLSKKKIIIKGVLYYLKSLFILVIIILSFIVVFNLFGIDTEPLKYPIESDIDEVNEKGVFYALFFVVFFGPFIEELAFRLGLSFKRMHIFISVWAFTYMISSLLLSSGYFDDIHYKLPVAILVSALIYCRSQKIYDNIQHKYGRNITWISIILFGFLHVTNYDIEPITLLPIYFIMCLPQVLMGLVLVYYRVNLGFFYAFAFHCLLNGISFSIFMITT